MNFLIIHGTMGNPEGNWFWWLKRELESSGHRVFTPFFPTPEGQSLAAWLDVADTALNGIDPADTVLIGHSAGAILALRLAEKTEKSYRAVFIVCPFIRDLGAEPYDALNASFVRPAFDWERIRKNVSDVFCFAGGDDPYVPLPWAREVADHLGVPLTVVEKGGHLNAESGYREFPLLRKKIRQTVEA